MSERPTLKLKLPKGFTAPGSEGATPMSSATPKLKIKFAEPQSAVPSAGTPASISTPKITFKTPNTLKSTDNASSSKKRKLSVDGKKPSALKIKTKTPSTPALETPALKKIKFSTGTKGSSLKTPTTPFLKLKPKGRAPERPPGIGYDSEASDREIDPAIEEQFILRMIPGDDCEYIRKAIADTAWGPKSKGGADIRLKWLRTDGRRATLWVRGTLYAATLVDLPSIVEAMKSWDKKAFFKSADISQMLLVLGKIKDEVEAETYPLPTRELDTSTWAYAHGLTPPMRWARKRRFRPRVSNRVIEAVEAEVERLLEKDNEAIGEPEYEIIEPDSRKRSSTQPASDEDEEDYENETDEDAINEDLEAQIAAALDVEDDDEDADGDADDDMPAPPQQPSGTSSSTPVIKTAPAHPKISTEQSTSSVPASSPNAAVSARGTPDSEAQNLKSHSQSQEPGSHDEFFSGSEASASPAGDNDAASPDEDSDHDNDAEEDEDEMDEGSLEQRQELARQREEIAELEEAIRKQMARAAGQQNAILRNKMLAVVKNLRNDLALKKAAIGEGEADGDGDGDS